MAAVARVALAVVLAAAAVTATVRLFSSAMGSAGELQLEVTPPAPVRTDPRGPRLARRVILVVIDGLRVDHSHHPFFDGLRAKGIAATAIAPYPTWSRPGYISILTGVPPNASGIRTNRVPRSLRFDSVMASATRAGLVVASAGDIGMIPPLFLEPAGTQLGGFEYPMSGDRMSPPSGYTWPFADTRRDNDLRELVASSGSLLASPAELIILLAGDVDRAGHPFGAASDEYRDAAIAVDRELGTVLGAIDLATTAIIVVADHGHVDRGGHGGQEPEVETVPLILAGAGFVPGRQPYFAHTIDVAPTIAALLAIPAPGHGHGRTLVEVLALDARDAAARNAADREIQRTTLQPLTERELHPGLAIAGLGVAGALVVWGRRRGFVILPRGVAVGAIAWVIVIAGLVIVTHARFSPSAVPPLYRLQKLLAIVGPAAIVAQVIAARFVLRRRELANRLASANGLALAGLVLALAPIAIVRIWYTPPHVVVPDPFWLVGIPAGELAGGCGAAAVAGMLVVELIGFAIRRRSA
ncbi:MAG: alkaline phosphatase family protein [Kofleriaceae bacterium]